MKVPLGVLALAAAAIASAYAAAPSCDLVPGWTQHGAARSYVADNLFEYMDGNAEGYLLYGFVNMHGVSCEKGGVTLLVDVSEFADAESAFGMFSANRDSRQPETKLGMGGQIVPRRAIFAKGKFYVELAVNQEGDHTATLRQWAAALEPHTEGSSDPPAALNLVPAWAAIAAARPRKRSGNTHTRARLRGRIRGGQGVRGNGGIDCGGAGGDGEATRAISGFFAAQIGDDAFQATDQYLGRICIFRKGRLIGGYGKVAEGQDAVGLAAGLAARLP